MTASGLFAEIWQVETEKCKSKKLWTFWWGGKDHFSLAQRSEDHDNAEIDRNDADISLKAVTLQKQYLVFNLSETFHSFFSNRRIHS